MLLGSLTNDEYFCLHGTLVVTDEPGSNADLDPRLALDAELLTESAMELQPGGTVAHAGAGWLWGRVGWTDSYHVVRLEAHDAAPGEDRADWDEVIETPYWSTSGTVGLSMLTGDWDDEAPTLELGLPGLYRVRVSCVRDFSASAPDEYRPLRKIPPGFARPQAGATPADGAGPQDQELAEGDIWRVQFWPSPGGAEPPCWLARLEPAISPVGEVGEVGEVGIDPPGSGTGQYGDPIDDACRELATDLVALVLWSSGRAAATVAELAARLLVSPGEVRAGLRTAVAAGHLSVAGDHTADGARLALTPLPPSPPDVGGVGVIISHPQHLGDVILELHQPGVGVVDLPGGPALLRVVAAIGASGGPSALAFGESAPRPGGAPPRAGIITSNGELVAWQAGLPVVAAKVGPHTQRAVATPHGIVVIGSKRAVLVRPDGEQRELAPSPDFRVALSEDGGSLAIASWVLGRRPRYRLYLADLAAGSAETVDCPEFFTIDSLRGGVVTWCVDDGEDPASFCWAPGQEPWPADPAETQLDRVTGTCLTQAGPRGKLCGDYLVTRPDGTVLTVPRRQEGEDARLAPGGRFLYDFRYEPLRLTVTDVTGPAPGLAVTWPIPSDCAIDPSCGRRPTWEDSTRVLLSAPYGADYGGIRLDVTTGAAQQLSLSRQGRGEPGQRGDGTEFDIEGFVEPFVAARPPR